MRNLMVLASVVLIAACNNDDNNSAADLAASTDLPVKVDAAGAGCDVIKQDCPTGQKCTVEQMGSDPNTATFAAVCLPVTASNGDGMPCMRTNNMVGQDNCAKGLFCTGVGQPVDGAGNPIRQCTRLCQGDTDCATGYQCAQLSDDGISGLCLRACQPLDSSCATGLSCSSFIGDIDAMNLFAICRVSGPGAPGDGCNADEDCGGNQICDQTGECTQLCDDAHACPMFDMSPACNAFDPSSSLGICE